jgi:hypothetical protein
MRRVVTVGAETALAALTLILTGPGCASTASPVEGKASDPTEHDGTNPAKGDANSPANDRANTQRALDVGPEAEAAVERDAGDSPDAAATPEQDSGTDGELDSPLARGGGCAGAGAPLCLDFESGAIPTGWKVVTEGGGGLAIDETRAYRGKKALHISLKAAKIDSFANAFLATSQGIPNQGSALYVRMFIAISPMVPHGFFDFADFNGKSATAGYGPNLKFQARMATDKFFTSAVQLGTFIRLGSSTCRLTEPGACSLPVAGNQWTCLEIQLNTKVPNIPMQMYKNGAEVVRPNGGPWPAVTIDGIELGIIRAHGDNARPAVDVWIDDVAFDNKRVGCQ